MGRPRKIKERMPPPKRRSGITVAAQRRKGAGAHKNKKLEKSFQWEDDENMEMTLTDFREEHGIQNGTDMLDALTDWRNSDKVPALCKAGCEVNAGSFCEHNQPSILVRLKMV